MKRLLTIEVILIITIVKLQGQFTISTSSNPTVAGTSTGGGLYESGTSATVIATPATGYQFINWTEGAAVVSNNATYTFIVATDRVLVANFILLTYNISVSSNPPEGGSANGSGIYDHGSSITVMATSAAGYQFLNWTEGSTIVSTEASFNFDVTADRTLVANFGLLTYNINASASPPEGGSATGSGIYDHGSTATVTATPAVDYRFVNWTEGSTVVSTSTSYTFAVSASRTLVANFIRTFTIATSSEPPTGGTTSGGGIYDLGSSATVTATPSAGYQFVNWKEGNPTVSNDASYTFQVTASRALVANFSQITYTIGTSANPVAGGLTSGGGTYNSGASVTVTATPSAGYRFVNWTEGATVVSTITSYTFTAQTDRILVANFIQVFTIDASSNPIAGGTTAGSGTYDSGVSATVTATPSAGYRFENWTEGGTSVSTDGSYTFTVTVSRTLTANFIRIYTISTSSDPLAGGTTSGGGIYDTGASVTVSAIPAAGYRFINWTEGSTPVSAITNYTFTATATRTLVANFIRIYTVATSSIPVTGGVTSGSGTYDSGASVTVIATPAAGYRFVNWTEGATAVSASTSYTFTASSNRNLAANFIRIYTITTSSTPTAGGTTSGNGTYDSGESVTVTATPATGYRFVNWTEGGIPVSTNTVYTFSITASRILVGNFIRVFTITASSNPAAGGTTAGSGTYDTGASVTVSALPAAGYRFVSWTEGSTIVSTGISYTFNAEANRIIVANFIQIFTISASSNPAAGGTTTGSGTYDTGETVTVMATPAAGYRFVNWTEGATAVSASTTYTFKAAANRNLAANFIRIYTLTTSSSPAAGGTTNGSGTYDSGASVTVTATPATGYRFVNWTEGGIPVSTNTVFTFPITASRMLVGNFIRIFTVAASSNPATGGTATGSGTYDLNELLTVTATPASGYRFINWTEDGISVSTNPGYSFSVTANRVLVANFIQIYTISASSNPSSGGTTTGSGTYDTGATVAVVATPAAGYRFVNWTEGATSVSATTSYTFTVAANRNLAANFIRIYTITTSSSPAAGGTTNGNGTYDSGESVTVTATPAAGYRFVNWTEGGMPVSTNTVYTFPITASRILVGNFIRIFTVGTSSNPPTSGTTAGGGTYDNGASVTVTATPAAGYRFVNWTEGGSAVSTTTSYTFPVTANRVLMANFIRIFTVATSSNPAAGGSTTGGGTYDTGTSITVTATPAAGYRFVNWTEGGTPVSTNASYTFSLAVNRTLSASFIRIFTLSTSSRPATGGTTSGNGTYDAGSSVTVTATPILGYRFDNWTEGSSVASTNNIYTFQITANRNLVANFSLIPVILNLTGPEGNTLHNNDTVIINQAEAGSLSIRIESNFDWTVSDNSLWFNAVKENNTTIRVSYAENISVIDKTSSLIVKNQLGDEKLVNIRQKARISQLRSSKFEKVKIYPNPSGDYVYLTFGEEEFENIIISVTSIQGHNIILKDLHNLASGRIIELSISELPAGQYLINVDDGNDHKSFHLIKY